MPPLLKTASWLASDPRVMAAITAKAWAFAAADGASSNATNGRMPPCATHSATFSLPRRVSAVSRASTAAPSSCTRGALDLICAMSFGMAPETAMARRLFGIPESSKSSSETCSCESSSP